MINHFQELYHDIHFDDVVFMESSHRVGIGFRKILLLLNKQDFYSFLLQVRRISESNQIWKDCRVQSVMVETPCNELKLLITQQELNRLLKMMETANEFLSKLPEWNMPANTTSSTMADQRKTADEMERLNTASLN